MDWTKWDIKQILDQPFVPMVLYLEYAANLHKTNNSSNKSNQSDSPGTFDITDMQSMQQVISSGRK